MVIYGQFIIKRIQQLVKSKKRLKKKKMQRMAFFFAVVLLISLILFSYNKLVTHLKVKSFFNKYPDNMMIWDLPSDVMIVNMRDRFLGKDIQVQIHHIEKGVNYWHIAKTNRVDINTILGCNPYLTSVYSSIGEIIIAVNKRGILHYIQKNEDLNILSRLYNIEKKEIRRNNKIGIFSKLRKGDILFIPDVSPKVYTQDMHKWLKKRRMFAVPTNGWVAGRRFGYQMHPIYKVMKFHKGIDMKASRGAPIFASADGVVKATSRGGTYGKVIIIDHPNGYQTRYAHCSKIYVRTGRKVKQKQCIGRVGNTGLSTSPHLHFEIRTNDRPINPMKFLW